MLFGASFWATLRELSTPPTGDVHPLNFFDIPQAPTPSSTGSVHINLYADKSYLMDVDSPPPPKFYRHPKYKILDNSLATLYIFLFCCAMRRLRFNQASVRVMAGCRRVWSVTRSIDPIRQHVDRRDRRHRPPAA